MKVSANWVGKLGKNVRVHVHLAPGDIGCADPIEVARKVRALLEKERDGEVLRRELEERAARGVVG